MTPCAFLAPLTALKRTRSARLRRQRGLGITPLQTTPVPRAAPTPTRTLASRSSARRAVLVLTNHSVVLPRSCGRSKLSRTPHELATARSAQIARGLAPCSRGGSLSRHVGVAVATALAADRRSPPPRTCPSGQEASGEGTQPSAALSSHIIIRGRSAARPSSGPSAAIAGRGPGDRRAWRSPGGEDLDLARGLAIAAELGPGRRARAPRDLRRRARHLITI